jgi:hypothetical protein
MTPDRFQEIEELFHAARVGSAEERLALLSKADPDLRREVESLLAGADGGDFLDRPAIHNVRHWKRTPPSFNWLREPAWDPTGSRASSARAEWAQSFAPWTRA